MTTRLILVTVVAACLGASSASAQYYSSSTRTTQNLGPIGVRNLGTDPQQLNTRAMWLTAGWLFNAANGPFGLVSYDRDFGRTFTLRAMAAGGASWRGDRDQVAPLVFGEVGVFVHGYRLERIMEHLTLDFDYSSSSTTIGDTRYTSTRTSEQYVNVPGYRLRMRGVNAGVMGWYSLARFSGEAPAGQRHTETFLGMGYIGYSNAWVKSNAYLVQGYGYIGGARYFRFFIDLLVAPIIVRDTGEFADDEDDLLGFRLGVDSVSGKPTGFAWRLEGGGLPGGVGAYLMLTVGIGSNLHR